MDIHHKIDNTRVITGVTRDDKRNAWIVENNDVYTVYHDKFWEEVDSGRWQPLPMGVAQNGTALVDGSTHVAGILNKSYRFRDSGSVVSVEKFS